MGDTKATPELAIGKSTAPSRAYEVIAAGLTTTTHHAGHAAADPLDIAVLRVAPALGAHVDLSQRCPG